MGHHRLNVGVIGCGLIAQVMHLPHLKELADLFEVRALCDSSRQVVDHCAEEFGVGRRYTQWERMLADGGIEAVLVLTSGSHAPIAVAAANAGVHVFVEKPMCFSVAEGAEMLAAATRAGVLLMVGYPKRHDPAYRRAAEEVRRLEDLRFVRLTTMEAPSQPYVAHYQVVRGNDIYPGQVERWRADSERRVRAAIGEPGERARRCYETVLLDTMVHEFNLLRGMLGEPSAVTFASLRETTTTVLLEFGSVDCVVAWLDLPGIVRYQMEVCFYDPAERVRLAFGSPYLKNTPTIVDIESGALAGLPAVTSREVVSYEEPFKLELVDFHGAITQAREPLTAGLDGLRDIALCQSVITCATGMTPVTNPTAVTAAG
jgi:predicted dehydrogenase